MTRNMLHTRVAARLAVAIEEADKSSNRRGWPASLVYECHSYWVLFSGYRCKSLAPCRVLSARPKPYTHLTSTTDRLSFLSSCRSRQFGRSESNIQYICLIHAPCIDYTIGRRAISSQSWVAHYFPLLAKSMIANLVSICMSDYVWLRNSEWKKQVRSFNHGSLITMRRDAYVLKTPRTVDGAIIWAKAHYKASHDSALSIYGQSRRLSADQRSSIKRASYSHLSIAMWYRMYNKLWILWRRQVRLRLI